MERKWWFAEQHRGPLKKSLRQRFRLLQTKLLRWLFRLLQTMLRRSAR